MQQGDQIMTLTRSARDERALDALMRELDGDLVVPGAQTGERYLGDWSGDHRGRALALARPRTTADVAAIVTACGRHGVKIVVQGGHTGLVGGACPSADGSELVLSLERMNAVRSVDTLAGTAVVEAGAILAEAKARVDAEGALFPLSLGAEGSCQIGGNVATNAGGLNVLRYGMMRDLVLGLEVVLADGRVLCDLRGLRKNNTGFDWKQLFIGSEGTLGVVTAACVKIFPKPTQIETLWLGVSSARQVMALFAHLKTVCGDLLSAFEFVDGDAVRFATERTGAGNPLAEPHGAYALVELSAVGGPPVRPWLEEELGSMVEAGLVADGVLAESIEQARGLWRIREAIVEAQALSGRHLRTDVSVPIASIANFVDDVHAIIRAAAPEARPITYGHVGDGNIHLNAVRAEGVSEEEFAGRLGFLQKTVNEMVDRYGGSISAEHGIGVAKRASFAARIAPAELDLHLDLKLLLDPDNTLGPGRIFVGVENGKRNAT